MITIEGSSSLAPPADRLGWVLVVNATTSALGGLLAAVAPDGVDGVLGTGQPAWVRAVGLGLVVFAGAVAWIARSGEPDRRRWARAVSTADAMWVLASAASAVGGWYSATGVVAVGCVAAAVATFAALQWRWSRSAA